MRTKLQYFYSITIFTGALLTVYSMIRDELKVNPSYRSVRGPALTTEASALPALDSLFEVEKGLGGLSVERDRKSKERMPTSQRVIKKKNQSQVP